MFFVIELYVMIVFIMPAGFDRTWRNKRNLLYLGRGKRKNTQGTIVTDTLLLEDDQNQMKTASTSSSTVTAGSSSQNLEHLDWVRNWEHHATAGYQNALELNRHTHGNEKCASPLKRGSSRAKAETVSSLSKYIVFETNDHHVYLWAIFNFLLFFTQIFQLATNTKRNIWFEEL